MNRILAIDFGSRRVGLALSDPLGITAQGLETLQIQSQEEAVERIAKITTQSEVCTLLVGLPKNMDGTASKQTEAAQAFAEALSTRTAIPVRFWDERLTSKAALRTMREMGVRTKGRKPDVDRIAATLMLQEYLSTQSDGS
ncbi:MAG: Holliday junction resolvase RuvX [Candidatus Latescibacterota bacterium]